jgi:hypothetical protein
MEAVGNISLNITEKYLSFWHNTKKITLHGLTTMFCRNVTSLEDIDDVLDVVL